MKEPLFQYIPRKDRRRKEVRIYLHQTEDEKRALESAINLKTIASRLKEVDKMEDHVARFLRESPQLKLLSTATEDDRALLLRAHELKYITLTKVPGGSYAYSQDDVDNARMWQDKGELGIREDE